MTSQEAPQIRLATVDDYEDLCKLFVQLDALHVSLLPDIFHAFEGPARAFDVFREKVTSPDKAIFAAVCGNGIVGFAEVQKTSSPPYPMFKPRDFALIDSVFVEPKFRGSGLAHLLFEKTKLWAMERGISFIRLNVYNANVGALKFYQKEGLIPTSTYFELKL